MLSSKTFSPQLLSVRPRSVKAFADSESKADVSKATSPAPATTGSSASLPEPVQKVADFFMSEDFTLKKWGFYNEKLASVVESDLYQKSTGWKQLPEIINGRVAMISFVAGALAEVFGAGTFYKQLAAGPQIVLLLQVLLTAASVIPEYKGIDEKKLKELCDEYTLPADLFTP